MSKLKKVKVKYIKRHFCIINFFCRVFGPSCLHSSTIQSMDIYNYGLADWDSIRSALNGVDWYNLFLDCASGDEN